LQGSKFIHPSLSLKTYYYGWIYRDALHIIMLTITTNSGKKGRQKLDRVEDDDTVMERITI